MSLHTTPHSEPNPIATASCLEFYYLLAEKCVIREGVASGAERFLAAATRARSGGWEWRQCIFPLGTGNFRTATVELT